MAPIRYSLHYEDYSEHLMSRFGKLLQMQSLVDMTLMCSSHTLRVHKAVLAASSAYFQEVLQKQNGEPLIILKMRFSVLKCLVEFMYCGKTQCLEENLNELVSAAQFLKIKGLSKVTNEGLGINNHGELPVFTPPVVINRPPQSFVDLHSQDSYSTHSYDPKTSVAQDMLLNTNQGTDNRTNKIKTEMNYTNIQMQDTLVRIPFDIEGGITEVNYQNPTIRGMRPRRGRPSFKRSATWESGNNLGRAAERALLRREQDSRKAIHQLKHLQTKHMQDYMDTVTLSQAVNSICHNDSSNSYLNMDNDLMFMDQSISSNSLDPIPYSKDSLGNETITSNYSTAPTSTPSETSNNQINTAMSQYVNALKNAGLPTDLPILFESGDGSYINVNEQVLLDMVQSSEIQYEVIEQPNIIEKVADPSEIKSIDELSRSIERGEMLSTKSAFDKAIDSLNEILPDNLEPYDTQQNYVVLDHSLQNNNAMDQDGTNDFSSIESDMQFFTKSMSDDVKNYYEEQQLNETRALDQYCPSTSLDTSFNMSLLDTKSHYNPEDIKRNDACYDFSLQLPNSNDFKEDALDCIMATPKHNENQDNYLEHNIDNRLDDQDEIMKDLMNIENKIMGDIDSNIDEQNKQVKNNDLNGKSFNSELSNIEIKKGTSGNIDFDSTVSPHNQQWDFDKIEDNNKTIKNPETNTDVLNTPKPIVQETINLTEPMNLNSEKWDALNENQYIDKDNESPNSQTVRSTLDDDIPYAVGLLPLKQVQADEESLLKRKNLYDLDILDQTDAKYLKRKTKSKKL